MTSLFCRHNRFTADCPICSRGTVLDPDRPASRRSPARADGGSSTGRGSGAGRRSSSRSASAAPARGYPRAEVGSYEDADGLSYTVRLERVPGGLRLAEWGAGALRRRAARLAPKDLPRLVEAAAGAGVLTDREAARMTAALPAGAGALGAGASPGRSGDLREELRIEPLEGGLLRVARWMERPGTGWELREAPVMLPPARYVEAFEAAARSAAPAG